MDGAAAEAGTPRRRPRRSPLSCTLLAGVLLVAALVVVELLLRLILPEPGAGGDGPFLWPPNQQYSFDPAPGVMPGVSGEVVVRSNADGLRADPLPGDSTWRIVAIGGSTTACIYLDQSETWTALLQERLDGVGGETVWVGNAGKDGMSTRDHILQVDAILPRVPDVDAVLVLAGVNDLLLRLSKDDRYDPEFMSRPDAEAILRPHVFSVHAPPAEAPWYADLRLLRAWRGLVDADPPLHVGRLNDPQGAVHDVRREVRRAAETMLEQLPDLTSALAEFERNLTTLVERIRATGAQPILMTQPSLWQPDLPPELDRLVWMAGRGDFLNTVVKEYYTVEALAAGMAAYNDVTRAVAARHGVALVDLPPRLARDTTVFYDDVHFNESGAAQVAAILAGFFLARPPFAP